MGEIFSSSNPLQFALALLVVGAGLAAAIKIGWGAAAARMKTPHRVGDQMANTKASVTEWSGGAGYVRAGGEIWRAVSPHALAPGDRVRVVSVDGLTLTVAKET